LSAITLKSISNLPLSGSFKNTSPANPAKNPRKAVILKVSLHPKYSIRGLLSVEIGYPACDPIA
jgi:hypothetical protein